MAELGLGSVRGGYVIFYPDPVTRRLPIGWMNNWKYANPDVPTDSIDGCNGQKSIVRELEMAVHSISRYALLSSPVSVLTGYSTTSVLFAGQRVDGSSVPPWNGRVYEIGLDIS